MPPPPPPHFYGKDWKWPNAYKLEVGTQIITEMLIHFLYFSNGDLDSISLQSQDKHHNNGLQTIRISETV